MRQPTKKTPLRNIGERRGNGKGLRWGQVYLGKKQQKGCRVWRIQKSGGGGTQETDSVGRRGRRKNQGRRKNSVRKRKDSGDTDKAESIRKEKAGGVKPKKKDSGLQ